MPPGDKLFVDYAGDTVTVVIDRLTGKTRQAHLFVAVLGASSLSYAEARWTETLPDWIGCHVHALEAPLPSPVAQWEPSWRGTQNPAPPGHLRAFQPPPPASQGTPALPVPGLPSRPPPQLQRRSAPRHLQAPPWRAMLPPSVRSVQERAPPIAKLLQSPAKEIPASAAAAEDAAAGRTARNPDLGSVLPRLGRNNFDMIQKINKYEKYPKDRIGCYPKVCGVGVYVCEGFF